METTVVARLAGVPWVRLAFAYDAQGRRIGKKVWRMGGGPASGSGGGILVLRESWRFVYDGWNMIAEYQVPVVAGAEAASAGGLAGCALRRSYQWGLDVSGTLTGAGGVGGLLAAHRHGAGAGATATGTATMTGTFLPCYDGNGNVTELVNWASTTVVSARYEYSPFGETVLQEGEVIARENPFRFSTKYTDGETGLVYYGYRYYAPELGRWLGRDPIEERGGVNLFGMCGNNGVNFYDYLGQRPSIYAPGRNCDTVRISRRLIPDKEISIPGLGKARARLEVRGEVKKCKYFENSAPNAYSCCRDYWDASLTVTGSLQGRGATPWTIPVFDIGVFWTVTGEISGNIKGKYCDGKVSGDLTASLRVTGGLQARVSESIQVGGDVGGGADFHTKLGGNRWELTGDIEFAPAILARVYVTYDIAKIWQGRYQHEWTFIGDYTKLGSFSIPLKGY